MPQIIMTAGSNKLDGAIKGPVYSFLQKLAESDELPGLHIEPLQNVQDYRVRTGRVNLNYRAVLFKLSDGAATTYMFVGAWPHDDAIKRARQATLSINPINGIPEVRATDDLTKASPPGIPASAATVVEPPHESPKIAAQGTPIFASFGLSIEDLTDVLGIDQAVSELAMIAVSEDDILTLALEAVPWQGQALLALATGVSVEDTKEELGLDNESATGTQPTDQDVLDAMQHPAARMQFAFVHDNDDLRTVIESGDIAAWRTFLHPEQRKYATKHFNGPFRLSGGAGTGKTVVLLHRARELARENPAARILLTTYTKTLADSLKSSMKLLDPTVPLTDTLDHPGIYIAGIDAVANRVLRGLPDDDRTNAVRAAIGARSGAIVPRGSNQKFWSSVIEASKVNLDVSLANPTFLDAEYTMVVLPQRITTRDEYFAVRRPGRGVALDRNKRAEVWSLIEAYRLAASIDDTVDWAEMSSIAAAAVEESGPLFDHVLVDEGQDLTPSQWQFLRALAVSGPDDLFIAEDSHQRIYGHPVVLGRFGINIVGRSRRLTLNYRTTAQNLGYAISILAGEEFVDAEGDAESVTGYRSARRGPLPRAVEAASISEQLDRAAEQIKVWLEAGHAPEGIGVLVRDQQQMSRVVTGLNERGVKVRQVDGSKTPGTGQALVMTMHRAKGMEFECVIIFGASKEDLPAAYLAKGLAEADKADFLRRERSLLYVSATRARDELVIMWSGERSEMLPG